MKPEGGKPTNNRVNPFNALAVYYNETWDEIAIPSSRRAKIVDSVVTDVLNSIVTDWWEFKNPSVIMRDRAVALLSDFSEQFSVDAHTASYIIDRINYKINTLHSRRSGGRTVRSIPVTLVILNREEKTK